MAVAINRRRRSGFVPDYYVYLRNRKHVPCFYRVIQTRVEVWETEKSCGNTSHRRVFPQLSRVLPNFNECLHNSIETRSTCFLFRLENTTTRKGKTTLTIKMQMLFARAITTSTARASSVSPSSYTNTIFNQSAHVLSWDCFLNINVAPRSTYFSSPRFTT